MIEKEYDKLISEYSSSVYSMYSKYIEESNWGDKDIAKQYLRKYWLSSEEYMDKWLLIQKKIFPRNYKGDEEARIFPDNFFVIKRAGGILFEEKEFLMLQQALIEIGDRNLFVIQAFNDDSSQLPTLRMKFPIDISWKELMSGNFISSIIFETFSFDFFVFSESCNWGKYSTNEFFDSLDLIGVRKGVEKYFWNFFNSIQ